MDDHLVHPTKLDFLPKTFVQIILAAKWIVRHSSTSLKQQRRPLPFLLSLSMMLLYLSLSLSLTSPCLYFLLAFVLFFCMLQFPILFYSGPVQQYKILAVHPLPLVPSQWAWVKTENLISIPFPHILHPTQLFLHLIPYPVNCSLPVFFYLFKINHAASLNYILLLHMPVLWSMDEIITFTLLLPLFSFVLSILLF